MANTRLAMLLAVATFLSMVAAQSPPMMPTGEDWCKLGLCCSGTCTPTANAFNCTCSGDEIWSPLQGVPGAGWCFPNPCNMGMCNPGTCAVKMNGTDVSYTCTCPNGPPNVTPDGDEYCSDDPCVIGQCYPGTCTKVDTSSYTCQCPSDYTLDTSSGYQVCTKPLTMPGIGMSVPLPGAFFKLCSSAPSSGGSSAGAPPSGSSSSGAPPAPKVAHSMLMLSWKGSAMALLAAVVMAAAGLVMA